MKKVLASILVWTFAFCSFAPGESRAAASRGLWITCLGKSNVLASREGIAKAVAFAKDNGFSSIYIQVWRADKAWFDSSVGDASPFKANRKTAGGDPLKMLIETAHAHGIEVHAWINTLTVSSSWNAELVQENGKRVFTKDQHGRPALSATGKDEWDKYYQREDQLFLDPGDPAVRARVKAVVKQIATKYQAVDGIHFDYIRYPAAPPYIPGSRFNYVGLSYGYGEENVKRFKAKHGKDPKKLSFEEAGIWDDWKREQVTSLIREAAAEARKLNKGILISSAVLAPFDRAYLAAYQEWPRWAAEGIVDYVVLMNYSKDTKYVNYITRSGRGLVGSKLRVGLGAYLLADEPARLAEQTKQITSMGIPVVMFDYDSLLENPKLLAAARAS